MDQLRKYKVEIGIEVEQIKNTVSNFMLGATRCVCVRLYGLSLKALTLDKHYLI